jgi:hypothetical protein
VQQECGGPRGLNHHAKSDILSQAPHQPSFCLLSAAGCRTGCCEERLQGWHRQRTRRWGGRACFGSAVSNDAAVGHWVVASLACCAWSLSLPALVRSLRSPLFTPCSLAVAEADARASGQSFALAQALAQVGRTHCGPGCPAHVVRHLQLAAHPPPPAVPAGLGPGVAVRPDVLVPQLSHARLDREQTCVQAEPVRDFLPCLPLRAATCALHKGGFYRACAGMRCHCALSLALCLGCAVTCLCSLVSAVTHTRT